MATNDPQYSDINAAPPPAYSGTGGGAYPSLGEGDNDAAPPSYNPSAPPSYNPSAPSAPMGDDTPSAPPGSGPPIQYVQQPTPNQPMRVVQQQPLPQPAPQQQPPVRVVQQPTPQQPPVRVVQQQPQPNVRYVNQYGQPMAAPTVVQQPSQRRIVQTVQPVQQVQQVRYVNQFGQPIAAPIATQPTTIIQPQPTTVVQQPTTTIINVQAPAANKKQAIGTWRNPSSAQRSQRSGAALLGLVGSILFVVSLIVGQLAKTDDYLGQYTLQCTFYEVQLGDGSDYNSVSVSYNDYCLDYDTWDTSDDNEFCGTKDAANVFISLVTFAFILSIPGWIITQTCCFCERCCCGIALPKIFYILSSMLGIAALVAWISGDEICMASDGFDMGLGISPILAIVAVIVMFLGAFVAQ